MKPDVLEGLRFRGDSPRTMLDVGAFTQGFAQTFPTLTEPNPFQDTLAQLPCERLAIPRDGVISLYGQFFDRP